MEYQLSPVKCLYCLHLEKKINGEIGRCRELNRKVKLDNEKVCESFRFFLEMKDNSKKKK